ncbi:MAG: DUF3179 domain-containing protein [Deltaproteobacteria bacterium]|nr:DUF3179 domain-containing protein [Deltaproteobacteria bacterium]
MRRFLEICFVIGCLVILTAFNIDNAIVPKGEILSGGPPKDGIPAILNPRFVRPGEAEFLKLNDEVIGVKAGGEAKAYPIKILNWHEVVNDTISGVPIVVTF